MSSVQSAPLPQITRFIAGLVTNRNPIDTPFSIVGLNVVQHHDALIDGLNTELSALNTLVRRPGFTQVFASTTTGVSMNDFFSVVDLNSNYYLYADEAVGLGIVNGAIIKANSTGGGAWSMVQEGNFFYATNGVDQIRINASSLVATYGTLQPWGIGAPHATPTVQFQGVRSSIAISNFIPTADFVSGILVVTDAANNRLVTFTVNSTAIHVNITYTGNQISPNQNYTEVTNQTTSGTTTTDNVTITNGYQVTLAATSPVANAVMNYFPSTGISTLDYDITFTGQITLAQFVSLITSNTFGAGGGAIPGSASAPLAIPFSMEIVTGKVATAFGGSPTIPAEAIQFFGFGNIGGTSIQQLTIASGLADTTNPQYPIQFANGAAPQSYRYVGPLVNLTDTFTGTLDVGYNIGGTTFAVTMTAANETLQAMATSFNASLAGQPGVLAQAYAVVLGQTGYLVIETKPNTTIPTVGSLATVDNVLAITANTLVDNTDLNLNFQFVPFSAPFMGLLPTNQYQWAWGIRDLNSGHISNMSPLVTLGTQVYPGQALITIPLTSNLSNGQVLELYRTVDGGSSLLFLGYPFFNGANWVYYDSLGDSYLNPQIVGPIDEENDPPPVGLRAVVSHVGRLWGIVGNKVYFAGGPDTTNGSGNEAWPPSNFFAYPGNVQKIMSTGSGLAVFLTDDIHMIGGVDSSSFYSKIWMKGFGISNLNAATIDGQTLYVYTSKQQLHQLRNGSAEEIGFNVGDILLSQFPAGSTNMTFHRGSSTDTALYVSSGTGTILRFDPRTSAWSPKSQPFSGGAVSRVKSINVSPTSTQLWAANDDSIVARNTSVFMDDNQAYAAFATIGIMQVAEPGAVVIFNSILMQLQAVGTLPIVSVLNNEINTNFVAFTNLNNPVAFPTELVPGQSLLQNMWYLKSSFTPLPQWVNTIQVKITFSATDNVRNEVLGVYLK